ncbi:hypothetical protein BLNAU_21981 [Blattamonas nauphoetae]|uniref:HECT domain-containing protein n=1 Tax=Blattamonas nauphoetae TaxID=2049346 RepID=A0ABQ9WUW3_9EUKA|nr:hypothetical protein BLNAU_21981 [Blattamonas nauphoetae]
MNLEAGLGSQQDFLYHFTLPLASKSPFSIFHFILPAYNFTEQSSLPAVVIAVNMMLGMLAGFLSLSHRSQRITAALGRISDPPNVGDGNTFLFALSLSDFVTQFRLAANSSLDDNETLGTTLLSLVPLFLPFRLSEENDALLLKHFNLHNAHLLQHGYVLSPPSSQSITRTLPITTAQMKVFTHKFSLVHVLCESRFFEDAVRKHARPLRFPHKVPVFQQSRISQAFPVQSSIFEAMRSFISILFRTRTKPTTHRFAGICGQLLSHPFLASSASNSSPCSANRTDPSQLPTNALFRSLKCHCPFLAELSNAQPIPFVNGRLINSFSNQTIGTLFDTPILNITVHNPHEKMLVNVISPTGRKSQTSLPLNQLHYLMFKCSFSRDLFTQHYINFFPLFEDESHLIGTSSSLDTHFEYDGSVPTIRVVSNPAVDFRFFDVDGDLCSVYFDQQRQFWEDEADVFLKRTIQRAVEARIILRFVDGQEEDSKMDGVDGEWADISDIGSDEDNSAEDGDEDAHIEEETEEGDRDSYDPHFDLKSEPSLDSFGHIQHLFAEQASNSDTDDALSSDQGEIVRKTHRQRRRMILSRYNRKNNTSLTSKYPVQPLFTTVSLRLVKMRTICRLSGEMNATVECILPFVRSHFVTIRESFDRTVTRRLAEFLSLPDYLLDVQVKKMRKTGETQFESTVVESVEVVTDVEVRSEIVEVSVQVVSGLMECEEMEGTLKEDHFSFSLYLSSSFLSFERLLRKQLPQLGNVCWFTEPTNPSDKIEDRLDYELYIWCELGGEMTDCDTEILNPNMPIFAGDVFPSLPIRLTAVESLQPDSPAPPSSSSGHPLWSSCKAVLRIPTSLILLRHSLHTLSSLPNSSSPHLRPPHKLPVIQQPHFRQSNGKKDEAPVVATLPSGIEMIVPVILSLIVKVDECEEAADILSLNLLHDNLIAFRQNISNILRRMRQLFVLGFDSCPVFTFKPNNSASDKDQESTVTPKSFWLGNTHSRPRSSH